MASEDWLCKHFHIPLQSGDEGILKKMNRTYTAKEFEGLLERIYEAMPLSAIGVDTMGTPAANFTGQLDGQVIKDRAGKLRELGQRKRRAFYRTCVGKSFSVLTEGWQSEVQKTIKGLSDNYLPVTFTHPRLIKNKLVQILMERVGEDGLTGSIQS